MIHAVVYNFTRPFATLDGFLAAGVEDFIIVLDNVPYAFVEPSHRYYCGFGLGSAPDDPEEFATFVEYFINSLAQRCVRGALWWRVAMTHIHLHVAMTLTCDTR